MYLVHGFSRLQITPLLEEDFELRFHGRTLQTNRLFDGDVVFKQRRRMWCGVY
jgi:hypothetical protein